MKPDVKPTQTLLSAAVLLTCVAQPSTVFAGSEALSLPDVTVTGRKIEERLSAELEGIGHHVEVIKGEELERKGFVDLNQALEALAARTVCFHQVRKR